MKKYGTLIIFALSIFLNTFIISQSSFGAEVDSEIEKFLQKSTRSDDNQPQAIDPHKDYLTKEQKMNSVKTVKRNNGFDIEYGIFLENVNYENIIILGVYEGMQNNKKAYILRAFLRDEKKPNQFNLMQQLFICHEENHIKDLENRFLGNDPEKKQKFIEQLAKNFLALAKLKPPIPVKNSPQ